MGKDYVDASRVEFCSSVTELMTIEIFRGCFWKALDLRVPNLCMTDSAGQTAHGAGENRSESKQMDRSNCENSKRVFRVGIEFGEEFSKKSKASIHELSYRKRPAQSSD